MPQGVHKSKRPSGWQQREAKKKRTESSKSLSAYMLRFVKRPDDGHGSSEDAVPLSATDVVVVLLKRIHKSTLWSLWRKWKTLTQENKGWKWTNLDQNWVLNVMIG